MQLIYAYLVLLDRKPPHALFEFEHFAADAHNSGASFIEHDKKKPCIKHETMIQFKLSSKAFE